MMCDFDNYMTFKADGAWSADIATVTLKVHSENI